MEDARQAGDCDSGYSCAYTNNLAWRSERSRCRRRSIRARCSSACSASGQPMTPEERARQAKYRRSILDFVTDDTHKLETSLGPTDRRKLDEYLSSIREVERQIERAEKDNKQIDPHMDKPYGVPADFGEHFKLMSNMITIAFQADLTRIVTFLVTREGTSRPYRELGIPDGHHPLTHHRNQPELMEKVRRINEYHVQQFAGFVEKMKATKEGDRSLLDNCMIVYGAGLSDGNAHLHEDLPTLMRGPRRQLFQDRPPHAGAPRDADVQSLPHHDGPHGRARGTLRRFHRPPQRTGSGVIANASSSAEQSRRPGRFSIPTSRPSTAARAVSLLYGLQGKNDCRVAIVS